MVIYKLRNVWLNNPQYPITDVLIGFMTSVMEINLAYGFLKIKISHNSKAKTDLF